MSTRVVSAIAEALLDPARPCPAGLRAWNGSDPARRLAVHRNNVVASLVDALADTFPVVQALVGAEFFRAMAAVYVRREPPVSPLLVDYGEGLPLFMEGFAPVAGLPYLPDVARLEFARVRAFHAADAEPLQPDAMRRALANCSDAGACRLTTHPALQVVASRHAVVSIWSAHQGHGDLRKVDAGSPETALVVRPAFEVLVLSAPPGTAAFVQALSRGCDLADSAMLAARHQGFDLPAVLALLLANGGLSAIRVPAECNA